MLSFVTIQAVMAQEKRKKKERKKDRQKERGGEGGQTSAS